MASIVRHGDGWRAHIYVRGRRASRAFRTKIQASTWAWRREREIGFGFWEPPSIQVLRLDELRSLPKVEPSTTFSGVYFLWAEEDRLAYVGQSRNIAKRLATHQANPPTAFYTATFLKIPYPWQLAVEQLYIDQYLPSTL